MGLKVFPNLRAPISEVTEVLTRICFTCQKPAFILALKNLQIKNGKFLTPCQLPQPGSPPQPGTFAVQYVSAQPGAPDCYCKALL